MIKLPRIKITKKGIVFQWYKEGGVMISERKALSKDFMESVKNLYGETCVNCGSTKDLQYHHIVPLNAGGYHTHKNCVLLCYKCHRAVHGDREKATYKQPKRYGRKAYVDNISNDEFNEIMTKYINGDIGNIQMSEWLGQSKKTTPSSCSLQRIKRCKEWLENKGIEKIRNQVDYIYTKPKNPKERTLVFITYKDGTKKEIRRFVSGIK